MSRVIHSILLIVLSVTALQAEDAWYPFPAQVWDPPFDMASPRTDIEYVPTDKATKRWNIAAFIPHIKDSYWLAVDYGLVSEAKRLGVRLQIYRAGGYEHLDKQIEQVRARLDDSTVDGMIIAAVSAEKLNDLAKEAADRGLPVVDLINGMSTTHLAARSLVPYDDMGRTTGEFLVERHPKGSAPVRVAWFPGPEAPLWSREGDRGFREAVAAGEIEIVATRWGDTGRRVQSGLVEEVLDADMDIDYIVGTAVTAESAVSTLRRRKLADRIKVIAYYFSPGVHRGVVQGKIIAAPTDHTTIQARISLDQLVRILDRKPVHRHVAANPSIVDPESVKSMNRTASMAPTGFTVTYTVE